ncbi:T-cell leukemia translocation-altered gene protein isoform X2 [Malaclemys terrapin pileata]|uniref:T-cell leukemia translocation-altered gene protein isoform X2 n=1 Tax=Malaclemys terrapin pileata TaxID=2991368 RepID=UPI0023A79F9B|nr:T-cell leukemia translocation-altered gene protein isoform X2 [Malaclemys terrapin pileata]
MAAPWLGWEAPGRALRGLAWLGQEFAADWAAQDLRAALFQLLLLWLGLSLLGIHLAWRLHGGRVSRLCCRPGTGQTEPPGLGCAAAQVPTGTNGAPGPGPSPPPCGPGCTAAQAEAARTEEPPLVPHISPRGTAQAMRL